MKPARRPLLGALAAAALLSFLLILDPPGGLLVLFPSSLVRSSPYAHRPKLLFLLAGQSNMAGRGALPTSRPQLPPPYHTHPRILRLSAARRWVAASPPLHADIDTHKTCGLGPAMPFAHRVLSSVSADSAPSSVSDPGAAAGDDPLVLGLVPCAVGGTRIWMWARGQPLYEAAVVRTRAAVVDGGGTLGAVLWFQGESDTIEMDDARSYGSKMERLVADLRADLGLPNLLVIQVGLASGEGNYTDIVREAQKSINLPNVILVDAMGLPLRDDQLHLSTEAQLQLGDMLAQAYLEFNSSREPRL